MIVFVFLLLTDRFVFFQIQEKAEIFARGVLGEADADNLRSGAPGSGGDEAPGQDEGGAPGGQEDDASKIGEV